MEQKLPTCTVAGHTEYSYCSVCNDFITPKVTIPALGHYTKVIEGTAATCDTAGITDGEQCETCGVMVKEQKEIPALGHKIEYLAPVEATCEMTGLTAGYACVRCDKVYTAQEVIPLKDHVDEDGDNYCDVCGAEKTSVFKEVEVVDGENVAGNWYRIYRPVSGYISYELANAPITTWNYSLGLILMANCGTGEYSNSLGYVYGAGPMGYTLEGMDSSITDEYIDVYLEVGTYTIVGCSERGVTVEITEESTISLDDNGSYIKRLQISEDWEA